MSKPNILIIMTDQQRSDSMGCYGAGWVSTPHLDRLAAQGCLFENCIINNPICTPSRASIFTGKELPGHGVYRLHDNLPLDEICFPEYLRANGGYKTALFGKWHLSGRVTEENLRHPHDGFQIYEWCMESCVGMESRFNGYVSWLEQVAPDFLAELKAKKRALKHHPENLHFTHWAAERTIDFLRQQKASDQPFFCLMSIFDPHNPYEDYPTAMAGRIDRSKIPHAIPRTDLPACALREKQGSYLGNQISNQEIEDMRFGYAASLAFADDEIGRVLAALDDCGMAENTLVIFLSDHGDSLGDHGLLVKGVAPYDPVVKVPLILRWPGRVAENRRIGGLAQGHDIAATCLSAAGLADLSAEACPASLDLLEVASGASPGHETAVTAYRNSGINRDQEPWDPAMNSTMVRDARHKLIAYSMGGDTELELFDLQRDPKETENRIHDPDCAQAKATLSTALLAWLHQEAATIGSRGGSSLPRADQQINNFLKS